MVRFIHERRALIQDSGLALLEYGHCVDSLGSLTNQLAIDYLLPSSLYHTTKWHSSKRRKKSTNSYKKIMHGDANSMSQRMS